MTDETTEVLETEDYNKLRDLYNEKREDFEHFNKKIEELRSNEDTTDEQIATAEAEFDARYVELNDLDQRLKSTDARNRAIAQFRKLPEEQRRRMGVREPDIYEKRGRYSFFADMYNARQSGDRAAAQRIEKHQTYELEQRAATTTTFGGLIPPVYLLDLYAKASRNGRVFCDQVDQKELPDTGMSIIVPRVTTATAAAIQATENTAATTQDPAETDLTVNVRTIAGYNPVSRQGLERAQYDDQILFEDLIARYWASLDSGCLNGAGSAGTILGLIATSGIATSTATTITAAGVYPKIADLAQQISANVGGLGFYPNKLIMHPRRWGFFAAALDSQNRPLVLPQAGPGSAFNAMGTADSSTGGVAGGYGGPVGQLQGFPVYTDANVPTSLGTNTNEDRIIMISSPVVHLWERANDPVTLSFEQQAGTSLQVQLVVFGYVAFTAGRYPGASGIITGLTPPSF